MRITLNDFIKKYYKKLNFIDIKYNNKHKQYLQFEYKNKDKIIEIVNKYNNIKVIEGSSEYALELKKIYVTLK